MICLPCQEIGDKYKKTIAYYKAVYEKDGKIHYIFRRGTKHPWEITTKEQFSKMFDTIIKPNLNKGASYYNIMEFKEL